MPRNPTQRSSSLLEFQDHLNPQGKSNAFVQLELIFLTYSPPWWGLAATQKFHCFETLSVVGSLQDGPWWSPLLVFTPHLPSYQGWSVWPTADGEGLWLQRWGLKGYGFQFGDWHSVSEITFSEGNKGPCCKHIFGEAHVARNLRASEEPPLKDITVCNKLCAWAWDQIL